MIQKQPPRGNVKRSAEEIQEKYQAWVNTNGEGNNAALAQRTRAWQFYCDARDGLEYGTTAARWVSARGETDQLDMFKRAKVGV